MRENPSRKAYGLVEIILGLAIMGGVILGASRYVQQGSELQVARGMAQRATEVNAASDVYLRTQIGLIQDNVPVGGRTVIPLTGAALNGQGLPSLQAVGALGTRFQALGPYGQTSSLVVERLADLPNGAINYEAYVVNTGGRRVPDRILAQASGLADGRSGAILERDPVGGPAAARGFRGGWVIPTADLESVAPGSGQQGRMVSYVSMSKGLGAELQGKWLSRIPTGDERDNRMETNINVAGNALNNVGTLTGSGLVANGDSVLPLPPVPQGQIAVDGNLVLGDRSISPDGAAPANTLAVNSPRIVARGDDTSVGGGQVPSNPALSVPSGKAMINDLTTNRLNARTVIYDGDGERDFPATIRLSDLIPRFVMRSSWVASNGQEVLKETCGEAPGNYSRSRIFVVTDQNRNVALPVVETVPTLYTQYVTVVTGVSSDADGNISVSTSQIPIPSDITTNSQTTPVPFQVAAYATQSPSPDRWIVNLRSQYLNPQSGTWVDYGDNGYNRALIQVYCYYG